MSLPTKNDVLGTAISAATVDDCIDSIRHRPRDRAMVINVCNVHSVMSARDDRDLADALRAGDINTSDGMPLVWYLRSRGVGAQARLTGASLADAVFAASAEQGWRHYFHGSTDETLARMTGALRDRHPHLLVAGTFSPPFGPLEAQSLDLDAERIARSGADIVWVGLGMPKQEKWMHAVRARLPGRVLVGIGAAFEFFAGTQPRAPSWLQERGLEWAYRLAHEPRRLWRRYAKTNPAFLALWCGELIRDRARG